MKRNSLISTICFCLLYTSFGFRADAADAEINNSAAMGGTIKLGLTTALTGPLTDQGKALAHGIDAYFEKVNAAGGIHGRKLELVIRDDGGDAKRTVELTRELIHKDQVFALLGTFGAPNTSAIIPIVERDDIPLVGPTTPMNYSVPVRKNVFMIRPSTENEDAVLVQHLVDDLGITEVGVIYKDDALGLACRGAINSALNDKSKAHISISASYREDSGEDVDQALETLIAAKPKAVKLCARGPAAIAFVKKAAAKGFNPVLIGNVTLSALAGAKPLQGLKTKVFITQASPLFTDTSFEIVKHYQADMKAAGFSDFYSNSIDGYVAAVALVEGLRNAGRELTRDNFRKGLESINFTYGGVNLSLSPTNHQARTLAYLVELVDGKLVSTNKMKK